jgi:hypothetical protein
MMHHVTAILITEELITVERLGIIHLDQNIATPTWRPHPAPRESVPGRESQEIQSVQGPHAN